jgi:hypothetical protein
MLGYFPVISLGIKAWQVELPFKLRLVRNLSYVLSEDSVHQSVIILKLLHPNHSLLVTFPGNLLGTVTFTPLLVKDKALVLLAVALPHHPG